MNRELAGPRSALDVVRLDADRISLIGSPAALHQQLEARRRAGVLLSASALTPTPDGRFLTTVTVARQHRPYRPVVEPGRRAMAGVAVVAGGWTATVLVLLAVAVLSVVVLWQLRLYILGGAGILCAALFLLGRLGVCPGIHCPGCPH